MRVYYRRLLHFFSILLLLVSVQQAPADILGSCAEDTSLTGDSTRLVWIIQDESSVYAEETGEEVIRTLPFGYAAGLETIGNGELLGRVSLANRGRRIGWVDRNKVLCRGNPLKTPEGIERKLFIAPPPTKHGRRSVVRASRLSEEENCEPYCLELTRFQLYYVYAIDTEAERYLLSSRFKLEDSHGLTGWVRFKEGVAWNTALGLRPADDSSINFLYENDQDALTTSQRRFPVLGNTDGKWYQLQNRMPILESRTVQGRRLLRVAAPSVGVVGALGDGAIPQDTVGNLGLNELQKTDVFFVIDGTRSVAPYIDEVKAAVTRVVDSFVGKTGFQKAYFRFGFRIYRDDYADAQIDECVGGVCESLPLGADSCNASREAISTLRDRFLYQLDRIHASSGDSDDYPEKLFAGIEAGMQDMATCPGHKKVMFVLGDHGDRELEAPKTLVEDFKRFEKPVALYFVQTPRGCKESNLDCEEAYDTFARQGRRLIEQINPSEVLGKANDLGRYFVNLRGDLAGVVADEMQFWGRSDIIGGIQEAIRGGHALEPLLLQYMEENVDFPVLYWEQIRRHACGKLGTQCQQTVDHRVIQAVARADDEWADEVRITHDELEKWLVLLRVFETDLNATGRSVLRRNFIATLGKNLQDMIGKPKIDESREKLGVYIKTRRGGIPVVESSPLMQYTLRDLLEVDGCELRRLDQWVRGSLKILRGVATLPTQRIEMHLDSAPEPDCDARHSVPRLRPGKKRPLGPDDSFSYAQEVDGRYIYWLPREFMP
ncbi:MAG: VWA domain-containing protein [Gammaproteobacteria bacterium]|nr:VWA domain-containing protein [Gammaproteobacteria bacterium]